MSKLLRRNCLHWTVDRRREGSLAEKSQRHGRNFPAAPGAVLLDQVGGLNSRT